MEMIFYILYLEYCVDMRIYWYKLNKLGRYVIKLSIGLKLWDKMK
jgi:hypothetical protein